MLDGGDADFGDGIELVGLEKLDVVEISEFAMLFGRGEHLKFFFGLLAEGAAVDEEEDAARAGVFYEAVAEIAGGKGLAASRGQLD